MENISIEDLHDNFILLHRYEHLSEPKAWVVDDETYTDHYHDQWDHIMPVVEKIEREGYSVIIWQNSCHIQETENLSCSVTDAESKIMAVYRACVGFLKDRIDPPLIKEG